MYPPSDNFLTIKREGVVHEGNDSYTRNLWKVPKEFLEGYGCTFT